MSNTANNFMASHRLAFSVERVNKRPDSVCDWQRDPGQRHWRFEFRTLNHDTVMSGHYTQGSAHKEAPTAEGVLQCLAWDARSFGDCRDILEFASEFGHDLNTREDRASVRRAFNGCAKASADLTELLGENGLTELLETADDFDDD